MENLMTSFLRVLMIDAKTSFYRTEKFKIGEYFGPVDLGLHLAGKYNSLNIGAGLLAGSIFPGSNRLIINGFSNNWGGFYVSSMGGAALVFDNLGVNMVSIIGKASTPSVLYLNRVHGEEIEVEFLPVDAPKLWKEGRTGVYSIMDYSLEHFQDRYLTEPRVLAVGPAAASTDFGAIASAPVKQGKNTFVDTWAGRGGFGSKMYQEHGIVRIIYGGTYLDEDFRDRNVANQWFEEKYQKKLAAKDMEATTKYRFDPSFNTGGTFGVNYATLGGKLFSFNYNSIFWDEAERVEISNKFIVNHYLKQFNEETIEKKQQHNCGEPCVAVCKKMNEQYKKDYEPYQTMGPLCGIFDQRAAERVNHHADAYGFDAISVGGVLSWLMECLNSGALTPDELCVPGKPVFHHKHFDVVESSRQNADIAIALLDAIIERKGIVDMHDGAREFARKISRLKGINLQNSFVYTAFARKGWMVPNQYWTPGAFSPMPIMGKYYMYYGNEFVEPRELGHLNADRMKKELILDNMGFCRFHRNWAEEMAPEIFGSLFGLQKEYVHNAATLATRINSRNSSVYWESERNVDIVHTFLKRKKEIDKNDGAVFSKWYNAFNEDKNAAALEFWYEIHKGVHQSLREF